MSENDFHNYNAAFLTLHDASSFVGYSLMMSVSGQFYSLVCVRDICSFFPLKIYIYYDATGADKDFKNTTSKFCQLFLCVKLI